MLHFCNINKRTKNTIIKTYNDILSLLTVNESILFTKITNSNNFNRINYNNGNAKITIIVDNMQFTKFENSVLIALVYLLYNDIINHKNGNKYIITKNVNENKSIYTVRKDDTITSKEVLNITYNENSLIEATFLVPFLKKPFIVSVIKQYNNAFDIVSDAFYIIDACNVKQYYRRRKYNRY